MPVATMFLVILTVAFYLAGNPLGLALWPVPSPQFRPWQLVTYALLHGNVLHLVVNLLALLSFGPTLERSWGRSRFLLCYAAAASIGGGIQALLSDRPVVGASAALFGLFAAWVVENPRKRVVSIIPWPMEAWQVLVVYIAASVTAWMCGWLVGLAHAAHLGGAAVGLAFAFARNNEPRR